ncbi:DUF4232 domain-containing protein [Nonomuraea sp. 3-1Str]|uniref:DUF4232 domain-containing protein n=1 Tax=Nonomuraea sp. 3-1Str TaxID=2929801 RepID=UPI00285735EB|nr:DUF4232 domain-containing protein [Nonomuraea sp. 3-1Str]MDR8412970.1 DUF4232 domain-containing protein [Nonomuraea sp. 3-1Str]
MRKLGIAGIIGGLLLTAGTACTQARPASSAAASSAPVSSAPVSSTTASSTTGRPAGADVCSAGGLRVRLGRVDPGAGNRYAPLTFTNVSGAACVLSGHPGIALLDADGGLLPVSVRNLEGPGEVATLEPGASVSSVLHWTVVEPGCVSPARLRATPPGGGPGVTVRLPGGPVCGGVDVTPVG